MVNSRGLSLAEAVIAIFVLMAGVLAISALMHASFQRSRMALRRSQAALVAASTMAKVRAWAAEPANFASAWDIYDNDSFHFDQGYVATVKCDPLGRSIYSPSTSLEQKAPARMRSLRRSVIPVEVTVSWPESETLSQVHLATYIGEPPLDVDPGTEVEVSATRLSVPADETVDFTAQLLDSSGNAIDDLTFNWSIVPVSGNATLVRDAFDRTGQNMRLLHEYLLANSLPATIPGEVDISCVVRYLGRFYFNGTAEAPDVRVRLE